MLRLSDIISKSSHDFNSLLRKNKDKNKTAPETEKQDYLALSFVNEIKIMPYYIRNLKNFNLLLV